MFSGGQDCTIKLCARWEELLSKASTTSEAVRVQGLDWFLYLDIRFHDDVRLRVGFAQIPEAPVSCATQIRYILDSMDPDGSRYTVTRGTVAVCGPKTYKEFVSVPRAFIEEHLMNDGWLTVFAELRIFSPVHFTPIPAHLGYSFISTRPFIPVAERNGLTYVITRHSDVSEDIAKCAVQSIKGFDTESAVTLGLIEIGSDTFIGTSFNMETREIGVTQVDTEHGRIQLDVVGLEGGVETRIYPLPQNDIEFEWREAVRTSEGWMMSARGTDDDPEDDNELLYFQFWLLTDQMTLYLELTRPIQSHGVLVGAPYVSPIGFKFQSINYNTLFCTLMSPGGRQLVLVCDLEEPSVWREYDMCPALGVNVEKSLTCKLLSLWAQPVLAAYIEVEEGYRCVLFNLEFTTTDCLLVPFLALPLSFDDIIFYNSDTLVSLRIRFDSEKMTVTVLPLLPPSLKTLAVVKLQKLLGKMKEYEDALGQPIWTQWKKKLAKLIGHKTLTCYL